jgi:hypothetical protein
MPAQSATSNLSSIGDRNLTINHSSRILAANRSTVGHPEAAHV